MSEINGGHGEIPAPWAKYAKDEEKQQLAEIEERHRRQKAISYEGVLAKRRKIMRRCIKRMRRAEGKE